MTHASQPPASATDATPLLLDSAAASKYGGLKDPESQHGVETCREQEEDAGVALSPGERGSPELHSLSPVLVGSARKTFFNIVITIVGSGVLGLPYTFMRAGWLLGSAAIIFSALLSYYCMLLLIRCRKKLVSRGVEVSTYSAVGQHACGDWGEQGVNMLVLVSQGGCCVAYLIFISQNLSSIFCAPPETGGKAQCSGTEFVLFALPVQVALSWVRSLTGLVPFSIVADFANLVAMGLVMRADLQSFEDLSNIHAFTGLASIPFALGVACYCYEGFAMTLPLEASMKNPRRYPFILGLAMVAITVLYLSFGLVGYVVFKEHTKEIITLNLPNDWTTITVKLGLCLGLFLTFPVMMHPVHEIVEDSLARTQLYQTYIQPQQKVDDSIKKLIRALMVLLTAVLAIRVPAFALFISLVGSSVCALLAFVLPGFFHILLTSIDEGFPARVQRAGDTALVVFGILFAVYGTMDAISHIS